jgi:osmotically-inducible protein OsmY
MAQARLALILAAAVALPSLLGGCIEMAVVSGVAAAGYTAGQERGIGGVANDVVVKTSIAKAFLDADPQLQAGITTTVYDGRVLLTGRVANPAMKARAVQIASRVPDVRRVYDEIEVAAPDTIWDDARDAWISTQIRSQMVVDLDIRSVNYTIETQNGSVYLIGSARSPAELERATSIARYVPGVRRVVSYVEIRPGSPVASGVAPPPGGISPPARAGVVPQAPIEVQKL